MVQPAPGHAGNCKDILLVSYGCPEGIADIKIRKWLNVGTVPMFDKYNVGTLVV